MPEPNIKRVIFVSVFMVAIGFWASAIAFFLYQMSSSSILLIARLTLIGSILGYLAMFSLPYEINLRWTKYTNRSGLSPGQIAQVRTQALYFLLISQFIGFAGRLIGYTWPLWIIPLGGGLLIGLSVGQIVFAQNNKSAVISKT